MDYEKLADQVLKGDCEHCRELRTIVAELSQEVARLRRDLTPGISQLAYQPPASAWDVCSDGGPHTYTGTWCSVTPQPCDRCGRRSR